jgi:hypothetical protein
VPRDKQSRGLGGTPLVLEVASGSGEHATFFASRLSHVTWQPSDADAGARASIDEYVAESGLANVRPAIALDAMAADWPIARADAVVCINMIHIAPIEACDGLMRGAAAVLAAGAPLFLYGPYKRGGVHTAESNARFDAGLRAQDPRWGVRDLEDVIARAERAGLTHEAIVEMPANNLSVVFRR